MIFAHAGHEHDEAAASVNMAVYIVGLALIALIVVIAVGVHRRYRIHRAKPKHEKKT